MSLPPHSDLTNKLALDANSLNSLKHGARAGSPAALKEAATQFEALFINMMLKSMREATPKDGIFDTQEERTFTTMLDQQTSQNLAKRGIGLADVLVRQLGAQVAGQQALANGLQTAAVTGASGPNLVPGTLQQAAAVSAAMAAPVATLPARTRSGRVQAPHVRQFQENMQAHAEQAERVTGIPAKFMLGQAALESGWGRRVIKHPDGSSSHNLFGIKAGPNWKGKVVTAVTTEYINGRPHTKVAKFRAYDSPAEAFKDYANMLAKNPRYEKVIANSSDAASFARGLQRAGYATDPQYAAKLTRIINNSLA